jgi:hypothetical protein
MTDDTNAALQALIKQVSTLTEKIESQDKRLDGLHNFNGRVLDEKKDLERKINDRPAPPDGFQYGKDGNLYLEGTRPAHSLTRAEARDPVKYHAAKNAAAEAGATLQIVDETPADDPRQRGRGDIATTKTTLIKDDDQKIAYMRRDAMTDPRAYQRLRNDGFQVEQWATEDDLPQHMRTKLSLMEKSHDTE